MLVNWLAKLLAAAGNPGAAAWAPSAAERAAANDWGYSMFASQLVEALVHCMVRSVRAKFEPNLPSY
jgi:hypothetical protein